MSYKTWVLLSLSFNVLMIVAALIGIGITIPSAFGWHWIFLAIHLYNLYSCTNFIREHHCKNF